MQGVGGEVDDRLVWGGGVEEGEAHADLIFSESDCMSSCFHKDSSPPLKNTRGKFVGRNKI